MGSMTSLPHKFSKYKSSGFPMGSCDTAAADGHQGSNVYEVNQWLWQLDVASSTWVVCLTLSVEETYNSKNAALKESVCGAETRKRRKADRA